MMSWIVSSFSPRSWLPASFVFGMPLSVVKICFLSGFSRLTQFLARLAALSSSAPYRKAMGIFLALATPNQEEMGAAWLPSEGLRFSHKAQATSLPSGFGSNFHAAGVSKGLGLMALYKYWLATIHIKPSVAPSSAPMTIRLAELHACRSFCLSRKSLAATMSFTNSG